MENILVVVWRDCLASRKSRVAAVYLLFIFAIYSTRLVFTVSGAIQRSAHLSVSLLLVDQAVTWLSLSAALVTYYAFGGVLITREKHTKTLEALLASPLSPQALWVGKSAFTFAVAVGMSGLISIMSLIALNVFRPTGTAILLPSAPATVFLVLAGPALVGSVILLLNLATLMSWNVVLVNLILIVAFTIPMTMAGSTRLTMVFGWQHDIAAGCATVVIGGAAMILQRYLTAERIVLTQG
jgi:ABC-type transport system involved in multi-copper enzyme maturation permease subunit